jgi:hypothetical protein
MRLFNPVRLVTVKSLIYRSDDMPCSERQTVADIGRRPCRKQLAAVNPEQRKAE